MLCRFLPHKWIWICNVDNIRTMGRIGLYQCRRCKEVSLAPNILKWGTGAINVDGCRVGAEHE